MQLEKGILVLLSDGGDRYSKSLATAVIESKSVWSM